MTILSKIKKILEYAKLGVTFSKSFTNEPISLRLPKTAVTLNGSTCKILTNTDFITEIYGENVARITAFDKLLPASSDNYLEKIIFPKLLTITFSTYGLLRYENLKEVYLDGMESVANSMFYNCHSIEKISLSKVKIIQQRVFGYTENLKEVYAPEALVVYDNAFEYSAIEELHLPNVYKLVNTSFANANNLKILELGTIKESIASNCFPSNPLIENLIIGKGTTASIDIRNLTNLTRDSLHGIIDSYENMNGTSSPILSLGDNISKISPEYIKKMNDKNISYR